MAGARGAALRAWEEQDHPAPERVAALIDWFFTCAEHEPPGPDQGAVANPLEDELTFSYRVPEIGVVVTYYVLVHELRPLNPERCRAGLAATQMHRSGLVAALPGTGPDGAGPQWTRDARGIDLCRAGGNQARRKGSEAERPSDETLSDFLTCVGRAQASRTD
jgi:hypothetical protein